MSDIFLSYKREEQLLARTLTDALKKKGWSVWWDPELRTGERFDDVIEKALIDAKCVIVMWSKLSVKSKYIKDEARYALDHDKLAPIEIEEVELPFRFKSIETRKLYNWDGSDSFPEFQKLVEDIANILGSSQVDNDETERLKKKIAKIENSTWLSLRNLLIAALAILVIATAGLLVRNYWNNYGSVSLNCSEFGIKITKPLPGEVVAIGEVEVSGSYKKDIPADKKIILFHKVIRETEKSPEYYPSVNKEIYFNPNQKTWKGEIFIDNDHASDESVIFVAILGEEGQNLIDQYKRGGDQSYGQLWTALKKLSKDSAICGEEVRILRKK